MSRPTVKQRTCHLCGGAGTLIRSTLDPSPGEYREACRCGGKPVEYVRLDNQRETPLELWLNSPEGLYAGRYVHANGHFPTWEEIHAAVSSIPWKRDTPQAVRRAEAIARFPQSGEPTSIH